MQLIILGLRRSGTTIFWQIFRQDKRFICYNEPFNPLIQNVADRQWSYHPYYTEFYNLWAKNPLKFWETYSPIEGIEEIQEDLSDKQRSYFAYLLASGDHLCFDITRCHFKIPALYDVAPEAVLVHLYRPPPSHVSSLMLPSHDHLIRVTEGIRRLTLKFRRTIRQSMIKRKFWLQTNGYSAWGFEAIIGRSPDSLFGHRVRQLGLDADDVYTMPAVARLLAYWRVNYERVEQGGPKSYGRNFISVNFDEFCKNPKFVVSRIYGLLGSTMPDLDFSMLHPPHGPYQPKHPAWKQYGKKIGLSNEN